MTTTTTGFYSGLTLSELEKHILFEIGQVTGTTVSYNRFPQWFIRDKLNDRQNKFVLASQCLRKTALLLCKADYRTYKLPLNCMDGGVIAAKYYDSSDSYVELEFKDILWLDEHCPGWLVADSSDAPMYCYMGESYGNIQMLGIYPPVDADGTSYTLDPDTGVVIGEDLPVTATNITGTATGGGGTTLEDSAVDFTDMGLVAGMYVRNVTDGSIAYIQTVAETTLTFAATLSGGSDNTFAAGDSYEILAGEYGVLTSWTDDESYIFGSEAGLLANITVPAGNIRIDYVPYPLSFPATGNDDQYPEIPKLYHMDYAAGVIADLLRTFNEQSKEFQRAQFYEQIFQAAASRALAKKTNRPFNQRMHRIMPKMRRRR